MFFFFLNTQNQLQIPLLELCGCYNSWQVSSKVLALKGVYFCVHVCGFTPLQGSAMAHYQDKGDEKMERERMRQYIWKMWTQFDSERTDPG